VAATGHDLWPWIEAGDEARCLDALKVLHWADVLATSDLEWLKRVVKPRIGAPPHLAIPWAAWAVRIGERARLPIEAGILGIVVTVLNARASAPGNINLAPDVGEAPSCEDIPDDVTRWSLAGRVLSAGAGRHAPLAERIAVWLLGLGEYPAASVPRNPPLGAEAGRLGAAPPRIRAAPGVREAVALWSLPALLVGEDLAAWSRFGQAVAEPVTLLGDLARLWLDPEACDLRDAALTPLLEAWLAEPSLAAGILRAYAGERTSAVRHLEIHSLLASEPYRTHLACVIRRALASAKERLPCGEANDLHAAAVAFLDVLAKSLRGVDALMTVRALLDFRTARPGHALRDDAATDARMAVAFLSEHSPWPGSWERQRFGVFGSADQPVGQWFAIGMILRALLDLGHDVREQAARLLGEIPPGELRYFRLWRGVPPDAESLGLMLELVAATGVARDRAETWIALLLANLDERGVAPTYFYRDPTGQQTTSSGEAWPGDDCNTVRLQLLCGLLAVGEALLNDVIQANAARVLTEVSAGAVGGVYFYDSPYPELLFLRFARLYRDQAIDRALWADIAAAATAIRARIAQCQRLDGGWGSPQRTAFSLTGYAMAWEPGVRHTDALLLERGLRYLGEHQLADGSWPAEPLYRIPLKRGREGHHQGRALTTAFCAWAIQAVLTALDQHEGAG
jgi:hypothetical protein